MLFPWSGMHQSTGPSPAGRPHFKEEKNMDRETVLFILLAGIVIPVSIVDFKRYRIPDVLTIPGYLITIAVKLLLFRQRPAELILLSLLGYIPFFLIHYMTKGRMGLGDAKFAAVLAVMLGAEKWFLMVFFFFLHRPAVRAPRIKERKTEEGGQNPLRTFSGIGVLCRLFK